MISEKKRLRGTVVSTERIDGDDIITLAMFTRDAIGYRNRETVCASFFDDKMIMLAFVEFDTGEDDYVTQPTEEIIKWGVRLDAKFVVLAHNHPNGVLEASKSDLMATKYLKKRLEQNGMSMHEHILVTKKSYTFIMEQADASAL